MVGLGEVLWDILPEKKEFGGAPANFAYHAKALGGDGWVVSCCTIVSAAPISGSVDLLPVVK